MSIRDLPAWVRFGVEHKMRWKGVGPSDDPPPTLMVERGGQPLALVLVFGGDRELYMAASALTYGFRPDALVLYTDAFHAQRDEDRGRELHEAIRNGLSLATMAAEGGLENGTVEEVMIVVRRETSGLIEAATLPYRRVPGGIEWIDHRAGMMGKPGGKKPSLLSKAMDQAATIDPDGEFDQAAARAGVPAFKASVHRARGVLLSLAAMDYTVIPLVKWLGPLSDYATPPEFGEEPKKRRPDPEKMRKRR